MTPFTTFCEITRGIVEAEGMDTYCPTWLDPRTQVVRALSEVPTDIRHRAAAAEWAAEMNAEEFYLAFADQDCVAMEHHAHGACVGSAKIITSIEYAS